MAVALVGEQALRGLVLLQCLVVEAPFEQGDPEAVAGDRLAEPVAGPDRRRECRFMGGDPLVGPLGQEELAPQLEGETPPEEIEFGQVLPAHGHDGGTLGVEPLQCRRIVAHRRRHLRVADQSHAVMLGHQRRVGLLGGEHEVPEQPFPGGRRLVRAQQLLGVEADEAMYLEPAAAGSCIRLARASVRSCRSAERSGQSASAATTYLSRVSPG